jgi:hypothetical protein
MEIEKIYLINLREKHNKWENHFKNIDPRMQRFVAIDSRKNFRVCHDYGLRLHPVGLASQLYFSQAAGAVGAYTSHYCIWKKMLSENIKCAMIIEDDIIIKDLRKFLHSKPTHDPKYDFCQLNKRNHHSSEFHRNFDGFESYVITNRGASKLINATTDSSFFNGIIEYKPPEGLYEKKLYELDVFKNEKKQEWNTKYSISAPVDKLAGFCSHPQLPNDKRLSIIFKKQIGLSNQIESSIMFSHPFPTWNNCNEQQLCEIMQSEYFKYWERGKYTSPIQI